MLFSLKLYDTELISFELIRDSRELCQCHISHVNDSATHLMPRGTNLEDQSIAAWIKERFIPCNREFQENILTACGIAPDNIPELIRVSKALSLNDCYWITEKDFKGSFKNFNLFENPFNSEIGKIAFTGSGTLEKCDFFISPELTTGGTLRKAWRRVKGKTCLFKGGTSGDINLGFEPYSELYASQIADALKLNHLPVTLVTWENAIASVSELFSSIDFSFVPMAYFSPRGTLQEISGFLKKLGRGYFDAFADMMIFDALIFNTDRHLKNFGLLVDNKTNQPCAFAPLFDHGLSLFNFAMPEQFDDLEKYSENCFPFFDFSFDETVQMFITPWHKNLLKKLQRFTFEIPRCGFHAPRRVKALENFIHARAASLLKF